MIQIIGLLVAVHVCARAFEMAMAADSRYSSKLSAAAVRIVAMIALFCGLWLGVTLVQWKSPETPASIMQPR